MFVTIKTKSSGRGGSLPDWSTSEMITSTDSTAVSSSARKWVIFPLTMTERSHPQTNPLPCRTFMPTNGMGWVEGQKGRGWWEQAWRRGESLRMCSHPKFDMFFPKNKGSCDYCTPLSHFQSTEMFTAVNFIELYSCFLQRSFLIASLGYSDNNSCSLWNRWCMFLPGS